MDFNNIIFPAPKIDLSIVDFYKRELIFIPKYDKTNNKLIRHIPALFLQPQFFQVNKILIYFHGNSEDIFCSRELLNNLKDNLYSVSIIAIEYPGYSVYRQDVNSEQILEDSLTVYDYFKEEIGIREDKIFVFGRSIGSAPAVYLCANRNPLGLILMSPFTSIRNLANDMVGNLLKYLISNRFDNLILMKDISCSILFIHGQSDTLINYNHTLLLKNKCRCPYEVILPEEMKHNSFHFKKDLLQPLSNFLKRISAFSNQYEIEDIIIIKIPDSLYKIPENIKKEIELAKKL